MANPASEAPVDEDAELAVPEADDAPAAAEMCACYCACIELVADEADRCSDCEAGEHILTDKVTEAARKAHRIAGGDPRQAVVDLIQRRLDERLAPVDAEGTPYHGVYVVTRRDLDEVLQDQLPPASEFYASLSTPGEVYVDALCPVCGIATEIVLGVDRELVTHGNGSSELKLKSTSKSRPHQHGQLRTKDHVVPGQVAAPFGESPRDEAAAGTDEAPQSLHVDTSDEGTGEPTYPEVEPDGEALDLGACPFPRCRLAAEHDGPHSLASETGDVDFDDDLLPF